MSNEPCTTYNAEWYRQIWASRRATLAKYGRQHLLVITGGDIREIFEGGGFRCCYCGLSEEESERMLARRLTLDRIDPTKPYTLANTVTACHVCNQFKANHFTSQDMCDLG